MNAKAAVAEKATNGSRPPRPVVVLDDILLELIDIGDNVRDDVGDLDELAASIAELGVLDPVKVTRQPDGRYRLVWGQRRVLASQKAGQLRIPAIIEPPSDIDTKGARRSIEQLSENLQRKDLNDIEEAVALREVLDGNPDLTQAALAQRLGRSPSWLANTLRLLTLDDEVQQHVRTGAISASHAKVMVVLKPDVQRSLAKRVVVDKLSAHQLEREISWKVEDAARDEKKATKTARWIPKAIAALEAELGSITKGVVVYVSGNAYDLDMEAIRRAVKKAGWATTDKYAWARPAKGKCDCVAFILEVGGRKPEVKPGCNSPSHDDRHRNAQRLEDEGERNRRAAIVAVLRDAIEREVRASGIHYRVIELVARSSGNGMYYDDDKPRDAYAELARNVTTEWRMRDVDLPKLFGELGLAMPADEPKPAPLKKVRTTATGLPRGTCPTCGADVALRKGGKVREHGRYDPASPGTLLERVCSGSGEVAPDAVATIAELQADSVDVGVDGV